MNDMRAMAVVFSIIAAGLPTAVELPELERPAVMWSEAKPYEVFGSKGSAVLESGRKQIGAGECLELDLWVEFKSGSRFVLNPHFETTKRYPGRIVVFNDRKEFVGDLLPPQKVQRAGLRKAWCQAGLPGIAGRRFRISVSDSGAVACDPLAIRSRLHLAPGKYHLQAIYLESFVSLYTEYNWWDTPDDEILRKLEAKHIERERVEACRSNIATFEVLRETTSPEGTSGMASVRKGQNELAVRLVLDTPVIGAGEQVSLCYRYYNIGDEEITLFNPLLSSWIPAVAGNVVIFDLAGRRVRGLGDIMMRTFDAYELFFMSMPPMAIRGVRDEFRSGLPGGEYDIQMILREALLSDNYLNGDEKLRELERIANEASENVKQRWRELDYKVVGDERLRELDRIERESAEKVEKRKRELGNAWWHSLKSKELFRSNPVRLRVRGDGEAAR